MTTPVYKVEKQNYSRGQWRVLLASTGGQVYERQSLEHPFLGEVVIPGPVCFDRKRDALAWVEERRQSALGGAL